MDTRSEPNTLLTQIPYLNIREPGACYVGHQIRTRVGLALLFCLTSWLYSSQQLQLFQ
jgi:hypothetical protein